MALFGRRFKRDKGSPIFLPADQAFKPQAKVTMNRDVNGWLDRKRGQKWHLSAGQTYYVDEEKAVELIAKGYAGGELPRPVSDWEKEEFRSQQTVIDMNKRQVLTPDG